ncbi:Hpt domain-containing response regulator [Coralloluteibacterium stylophorae]|uniref:Response regulator n=1 Tax=Coralloluteibacterium stylophorae TaxID=1776034 RepID=A0A8J7VT20_9GAMM|nr:response regulator [Coralloluteibacterium stylophorae]MBS7458618.1 response regulator [Coralloluteibacterium stylophorae]
MHQPSRACLLLVEDDPVSRRFLVQALKTLPAEVDAAPDAAGARAAAERQYALWLIDANLPDGDGESLLAELRTRWPATPALALTADPLPTRAERLRAAGFARVLPKPIAVEALHAAVRTCLGAGAVWDETGALAVAGGRADTVRALRALFLAELPAQAADVSRRLEEDDVAGACAQLHRLTSGCGFVGASRLRAAVRTLGAAPGDAAARAAFAAAVADTLAAAGEPASAAAG